MAEPSDSSSVRSGWAPDAFAAVLIALAFLFAVRTTVDLTWPPRWDFYRELGSIQAILDGRGADDPLLRGEHRWYNPLVPYLMATGVKVTGLPAPVFVTRSGPYLNLLVPIGFYLLFRRLVRPWPALIGLAVFLYWPAPNLPESAAGVYSPWAWPRNIAQGLYFVSALAIYRAFRTRALVWSAAAGALTGVTFLAHTAPALMLAVSAALMFAVDVAQHRQVRAAFAAARVLAVIGAAAFLTALPYLVPIAEFYRFHVLNRAPMNTVGLSVVAMGASLLSVRFAFAAYGALRMRALVRRRVGPISAEHVALGCLAAACVFWLGLGVGYQVCLRLFGIELLQIVPEYHFHVYLKSFEAAFAGVGIASVVELVRRRLTAGRAADALMGRLPGRVSTMYLAAVLIVIAVNGPAYLASAEFTLFRQESLTRQAQPHFAAFYAWAISTARPEDVFLADDFYGLFAVSPTGRKVVSIYPYYANPYVPLEPRRTQRIEMFAALNRGDEAGFLAIARPAGVRFVVAAPNAHECCRVVTPLPDRFVTVFESGPIRVYQVPPG